MGKRKKKGKKIPRNKSVEIINCTQKTHRVIVLNDEEVIFDEKKGIHHVLPTKKPNYEEDGGQKKEK
jgi:hypothetical protein|tara:strand:+ start:405 stop:605 length:201 start_codon:yes stop_codon:yes gene_type:complete